MKSRDVRVCKHNKRKFVCYIIVVTLHTRQSMESCGENKWRPSFALRGWRQERMKREVVG